MLFELTVEAKRRKVQKTIIIFMDTLVPRKFKSHREGLQGADAHPNIALTFSFVPALRDGLRYLIVDSISV
jgi:hypothetical protein